MSGVGFALDEAARSLWRNRESNLLSVITIAVAVFVFGLFAVAWVHAARLVSHLEETAEVSVYLADPLTPEQRGVIEGRLTASPEVMAHSFVSREDALRRFADMFPDLAQATAHALPASFEVRLRPEASRDAAALATFAARIQQVPGVSDVRYDRHWLDRVRAVVTAARTLGIVLSAVLALAAALTVTAVVRLALYARRDEIEIMQLVGAPLAAIRGPFVLEGVLQGALGALVALAALYAVQGAARRVLQDASGLLPGGGAVTLLPWTWAVGIVAGGVLVGCIGGLLATRHVQ